MTTNEDNEISSLLKDNSFSVRYVRFIILKIDQLGSLFK